MRTRSTFGKEGSGFLGDEEEEEEDEEEVDEEEEEEEEGGLKRSTERG